MNKKLNENCSEHEPNMESKEHPKRIRKHDPNKIRKSIEKWCPRAIRKAKEATVSPREPRGRPKGVHEEPI